MPDITIEALRRDDGDVVAAFQAFVLDLDLPPKAAPRILVTPAANHQHIEFLLTAIDTQPIVAIARAEHTSFWPQVQLNFQFNGSVAVVVHRTDALLDKFKVTFPDFSASQENLMRLVAAAHRHFGPVAKASAIERALGPELAEFYLHREASLSRLETLAQRITEETQAYRVRLDEETQRQRDGYAAQLSNDQQELRVAFEKKGSDLAEQERQLAEEKQRLDDRSARHVRRDSVKGLKAILATRAQKFSLTEETQRKRWPVHIIFIALLAASASVFMVGLFRPPANDEMGVLLWLHLLRIPGGLLGFAFAAVFYIRWNDHWFRLHADEEFRLRQLELDIDRASWVTELALELRDEKGDLPAALIDRLSAGLFVPRSSEPVKHPSQDILSTIIGASTRLKLTLPGGIEADVNRSGIKKVQDELNRQ